MSFSEFKEWQQDKVGGWHPPRQDQLARRTAYAYSWDTMEYVLRLSRQNFRLRFRLTRNEVMAKLDLDLPNDYVVVCVRTDSVNDQKRDIDREILELQLKSIRRRLPTSDIWIASDMQGTETVRSWQLGYELFYARDLRGDFASHVAIAIAARCFVQVRGGGLASGPIFSSTPFFLALECANQSSLWIRDAVSENGKPWRPVWGDSRSMWLAPNSNVPAALDPFLAEVAASQP